MLYSIFNLKFICIFFKLHFLFIENSVNGQFMMLSMDEFKYSARKKQLNKKIHDYWKQDSAQLTKV